MCTECPVGYTTALKGSNSASQCDEPSMKLNFGVLKNLSTSETYLIPGGKIEK